MIFANKQSRLDKQLLRLEREYSRLQHASWHAPLVAVERPYTSGWIKTYGLRDDLSRRQDAYVFRRILDAVTRRVYCRNRQFVAKNGTAIELRAKIIPAREWLKLGWPENHKKHFLFGYWKENERCRYTPHILGYKLAHEWILVEKIEPYLVTHVRAELPEVRRRIAEITTFMERTMGWKRLSNLRGRSQRWWYRPNAEPWKRRLPPITGEDVEVDQPPI